MLLLCSSAPCLLLLLLQLFSTGNSQLTCPTRPLNYEKELKKCLLQDYQKSVRPAADFETINTGVKLYIRTIDLDFNVLKVHAWVYWRWTDNNLKWNPDDHGNLRTIKILSDDIWQPDISFTTTDDASAHFGIPSTYCQVNNSGEVMCVPPTTFVGYCLSDVTRWPYDEQTCTVAMGSWSEFASKLNFSVSGSGIALRKLPSGLWDLKSYKGRTKVTTRRGSDIHNTVEYTFVLRRLSAFDTSSAVAPAFVLATTTLLTLLLEPGCSERLTLGITNVLAHVLFLQYMIWRLPPNGETVPAIVVFFRDSLVLLGGALVLGVATRRMVQARAPPPDWLNSAVASLLSHAAGQLLLLGRLSPRGAAATAGTAGEDGETLVTAGDGDGGVGGAPTRSGGGGGKDDTWEQLDDTWNLAAVFLDRVALVLFFLALLFLIARYIV